MVAQETAFCDVVIAAVPFAIADFIVLGLLIAVPQLTWLLR
jgi:hypothetical protein